MHRTFNQQLKLFNATIKNPIQLNRRTTRNVSNFQYFLGLHTKWTISLYENISYQCGIPLRRHRSFRNRIRTASYECVWSSWHAIDKIHRFCCELSKQFDIFFFISKLFSFSLPLSLSHPMNCNKTRIVEFNLKLFMFYSKMCSISHQARACICKMLHHQE